jgi:hypothetical protein
MSYIVQPTRMSAEAKRKTSSIGAAHMKKDAGVRDGGKEIG